MNLLQIKIFSGWTSAELSGLPQILRLPSAVLIISFAILFVFCFFYSTLICFRFHFQRVIETQVWFNHDWTDVIVESGHFCKRGQRASWRSPRVCCDNSLSNRDYSNLSLFITRTICLFLFGQQQFAHGIFQMQTNKRSDQTNPVKQDSCPGDCFQKMFQGWNFGEHLFWQPVWNAIPWPWDLFWKRSIFSRIPMSNGKDL